MTTAPVEIERSDIDRPARSTMNAVRIHGYGGPDVLAYESVGLPAIGADEILIRTAASGVNPADWKIRSGAFSARRPSRFPEILGTEVAGTVVSVGALVSRFVAGDQVMARVEGTYAEFVAAKTDMVALAPRSIPLVEAAALPVAGGVAWLVLFDVARLSAGQRVLIHAGAGGVGGLAIQLAKLAGAEVFTTCSEANREHVRALGADTVIDYGAQDFVAIARDMDVVFDTVGGETQTRSVACLKKGGLLASIVAPPDQALAAEREVRAVFGRRDLNGAVLEELARLVDTRGLKAPIDSQWRLSEAALAHQRSETGKSRGKILLLPDNA